MPAVFYYRSLLATAELEGNLTERNLLGDTVEYIE
jgi:hypothetical protein